MFGLVGKFGEMCVLFRFWWFERYFFGDYVFWSCVGGKGLDSVMLLVMIVLEVLSYWGCVGLGLYDLRVWFC